MLNIVAGCRNDVTFLHGMLCHASFAELQLSGFSVVMEWWAGVGGSGQTEALQGGEGGGSRDGEEMEGMDPATTVHTVSYPLHFEAPSPFFPSDICHQKLWHMSKKTHRWLSIDVSYLPYLGSPPNG